MAVRMGFRPDVERVPVFAFGCAGGVSGLSIAARLARSRPGSTVLSSSWKPVRCRSRLIS